MTVKTRTTTANVYPFFDYDDAPAAMAWLERAFGFQRGEVAARDDGTIAHAELWLGSGAIMLGSRGDGEGEGWDGTYVVADNVDELYERAKAAGATIVREVGDTDYGSRDFIVRDPEGKLWAFGTYQPE